MLVLENYEIKPFLSFIKRREKVMSERTIKLAGSFGFFGRNNDEKEQVLLALKRGTSTLLLPEEKLK